MDSKPLPTKSRWCSSALSTPALKSTLYRSTVFLPSPLLHLIKPTTGGNDPSHSSTAYLDGIRGLAAIVVYIEHFSAPFQPGLIGDHSREHDSWSVFQYPILRLIYSGSFAVSLFFVISGFALSRKPLLILARGTPPRGGAGADAQVQAQVHAQAWQTLSSASFRRGIRIFLPPLTIILFMLFGTRIYLFNGAWSLLPSTLTRRYNISPPKRLDSFPAQVLDCATFIAAQVVYPTQWMAEIPHAESGVYGFHLWTMPIEFWASQVVFGVLFAMVPGTRAVRGFVVFWVSCFAFWCGRWEISLFLAGVLLADLEVNGNFDLGLDSDVESDTFKLPYHDHDHDHGNDNDNDNQHQNKGKSHHTCCARNPRRLLLKITTTVLFILGLYIGSTPEMNPHYTPGFKTLWGVIPSTEFWQSLGAVLVILSISLNPTLQKPFSHSLTQYLGEISFGVYLVHVPLLCWYGWAVVPWLWGWTGLDSDFRYECAVVGGAVLVLGVVLWVADLFWRAIDSRCIRLGRGLERWLLQGGYREVFNFG